MITHIKGKLVEKNLTHVVVECNGLGYFLHISLYTHSKIKDSESIMLYTYLSVKEDSQTLFGFADKLEREVFKLLISVSGVGTSIARTMLSSMTPEQVQKAIASEDVATIQSVKGIGAKTAQRVILDLRDKIVKIYQISEDLPDSNNTIKDQALSALEVLGYSRKQVEKLIQKIMQENSGITLENMIKQALKNV